MPLKVRRYIAASLFIIFLIFQLIPADFSDLNPPDAHPHKYLFIFSIDSAYTSVALTFADNRKIDCPLVPGEFHIGFTVQMDSKLSQTNPFLTAAFYDSRKYIRKIIPNYFHGSKYKETTV
ncbi:hypothetical protein Toce_0597 [Thermosediminibacter oceani DSM 16646]|uniref:Uncharacterized protein n=1 Tax=Thermosediminibacter oceani (strain ATCC BAA-1034 / DSM 16646 / JW/IW-1228P) TaxID=555079 RepID=D9S1U3_THEOJ|nr:hypothetical protein Toce_0597 [Thermosediminibacter oceani DSM 16646]